MESQNSGCDPDDIPDTTPLNPRISNISHSDQLPGTAFTAFSQMKVEKQSYQICLSDPKTPSSSYHSAKAYTRAQNGAILPFCVDTGAGVSLIRRQVLKEAYPRVKLQTMPDNTSLTIKGILKGELKTREWVELPLQLRAQDGEIIYLYGEVHVVDYLPVPLVLGVNYLASNQVNVLLDSPNGSPALRVQNHYVSLYIKEKMGKEKKRKLEKAHKEKRKKVPMARAFKSSLASSSRRR